VTAREVREAFTPGPWEAAGTVIRQPANAVLIADTDLLGERSKQSRERNLANAKLISCAPQLVEALRNYLAADDALRALPQEPTAAWRDAEAQYRAAKVDARAVLAAACGES
jgi:hypothetical protein